MSSSLNKVQLIGNLTADPELKQTPNGQTVCSFSLATNREWKDAQGQKQEQVEYHSIVVWGKFAEVCNQYLKRGSKVYIEGRLQTRNWEGADGVKRYKTDIVAENAVFLGSPNKGQVVSEPQQVQQPIPEEAPQEEGIRLEDIPF